MIRRLIRLVGFALVLMASTFSAATLADRDNNQRKNGVNVLQATFGGTTVPIYNGCPVIAPGNVTQTLHDLCQGQKTCDATVSLAIFGDPAPGCWKSFEATYQCAEDRNATRTVSIPAAPNGADGQTVTMTCPVK